MKAGGKVEKFRAPKFGKLTRFHRRNHRRSIVIDGEIGFTGGMAVSDIWLGHAQDKEHWRDIMFKVTGPLARSLQTAFADLWASSSGELLIDPRNYRSPRRLRLGGVERFVHLANSPADDDQSMAYFFLLPIFSAPGIHLPGCAVFHSRYISAVSARREGKERGRCTADAAGAAHRQLDYTCKRAGAIPGTARGRREDLRVPANLHAREVRRHRRQVVHYRFAEPEFALAAARRGERVGYLRSAQFGASSQTTFIKDLKRSKAINLEEWRRRHPLQKFFETVSRILDQQS